MPPAPSTLYLVQVCFQVISSFALVGALIYTAAQFHRAREAQHVANFTKLVELQMGLRKIRVDEPGLASIYEHDVVGLNSDREIREHFMNLMQVSVFEIVWFSYKQGQLPRDYFESWEKRMRAIAGEDSFRRMVDSSAMKILHDEFERYIVRMVRDAEKDKAR